jgi:hypothetical protein
VQQTEDAVGYKFLSDAWFDEVAKIRQEVGDLQLPANVRELKVNVEVSDGPQGGTVQWHWGGEGIGRGLVQAPTKIKLPYAVARKIFVDRDQSAAMQAFMSGQIQIEGDMMQLMSMQSATGITTEASLKLMKRMTEITE